MGSTHTVLWQGQIGCRRRVSGLVHLMGSVVVGYWLFYSILHYDRRSVLCQCSVIQYETSTETKAQLAAKRPDPNLPEAMCAKARFLLPNNTL
jgi:hypothetical protein